MRWVDASWACRGSVPLQCEPRVLGCCDDCAQDGVTEEHTETDEEVTACHQWVLPAAEYHGLWERCGGCDAPFPPSSVWFHFRVRPARSLMYESGIKQNLLEYASTAMLFADKHVDSNIISWNRCVRCVRRLSTAERRMEAWCAVLCLAQSGAAAWSPGHRQDVAVQRSRAEARHPPE